jgi:hypothetical protein
MICYEKKMMKLKSSFVKTDLKYRRKNEEIVIIDENVYVNYLYEAICDEGFEILWYNFLFYHENEYPFFGHD